MKTNTIIFLLLLSGLTATCQVAPTSSTTSSSSTSSGNPKTFALAGCVELGGSFSFTSSSVSSPNGGGSSPSTSLILFAPYVGFFPVKGFELGLNPFSVSSSSDGNGHTATALLFTFAPSYNFSTNSIAYPFIEGEIGYTSLGETNSNSISGLCYGGRAGVKLALAPHALLDIAIQYLAENYTSNGTSDGTINNIVVGLGFTVNL